jgi:hypothetical protein
MSAHPVRWASPQPLWGRFGPIRERAAFLAPDQARPAILRFATDDFMERIIGMLERDPRSIDELVARPESWRTPATDPPEPLESLPRPRLARTLARVRRGEAPLTQVTPTTPQRSLDENGVARTLPLKLYHPAHQRFYLVAANLVCGIPGFPDRAMEPGGCERAGFVLRRLMGTGTSGGGAVAEHAFVKGPGGARWQPVPPLPGGEDASAVLLPGEEILPMFPLNFRDDTEHPRRILAGMVPVGRREEYVSSRRDVAAAGVATGGVSGGGAGAASAGNGATPISARKEQLRMEVVEPWKNLIRTAHAAVARINDVEGGTMPVPKRRASATETNQRLQGQSWLVLLDFADYLALHLPRVWEHIAGTPGAPTLGDAENRLLTWLGSAGTSPGDEPTPVPGRGSRWRIGVSPAFAISLREALRQVRAGSATRTGLERTVASWPDAVGAGLSWPGFLYLLVGVHEPTDDNFSVKGIHESLDAVTGAPSVPEGDREALPGAPSAAETQAMKLDRLVQMVLAAIPTSGAQAPAPAPPVPFAVQLREALASVPANDEGWFVIRCVYERCDCGPLHPALLSPPTQRFQLASFFDPDAPARPIRIALPLDTTPAGMRKFNRNTAFMISDVLCGQIQRAKGLGLGDLVRSVLPWPLHKPLSTGGPGACASPSGGTLGMICSLSIPIITICALILLMIIVTILDFIFRWIPYFIMCFPVPGMKAKR